MCFKIDWVSLIVGSKFTILALFYFVLFEGNFPRTSPRGLILIWRGNLTEGFLWDWFGELILNIRGAYTWRGLFSEVYGILTGYLYRS